MSLEAITVDDFKAQFVRDFAYLPVWDASTTYNAGKVVYYLIDQLFYKAKNNGVTSIPTTTADWELVADDVNDYVLDADITRAFAEAKLNFNAAIFGNEDQVKLAYLYLTAHYLVMDIRTAVAGLNSTGEQLLTSRSAGGVSESYGIPQEFLNDPILNYYTKTGYGLKYISLLRPRIVGNIASVEGGTRA